MLDVTTGPAGTADARSTPTERRGPRVRIRSLKDRSTIEGRLHSLGPDRLLVRGLPRSLPTGVGVQIEILGRSIHGKVQTCADRCVSIDIEPSEAVFDAIEALEDFLYQAPSMADLGLEAALDGPDNDETTYGRRPRPGAHRAPPARFDPIVAIEEVLAEEVAREERGDEFDDDDSEPPSVDLPLLEAGGVVRFRSFAQFLAHHEAHLSNHALLVRTALKRVPTEDQLRLDIPDAPPIDLSGVSLQYRNGQQLGFSFGSTAPLAAALRTGVERIGARPITPPPLPTAQLSQDIHHAGLDTSLTADVLTCLRTPVAPELAVTNRAYIVILDQLLRSDSCAVCIAHNADHRAVLWVRDGYIVAATRSPTPDHDRIGARLVRGRVLTDAQLRQALHKAPELGTGLGQVILREGFADTADVHRAIRQQTLSRILEPCAWDDGRVEVHPWSPPSVRADLVALHHRVVIAHLLRVLLRLLPRDALETMVAPLRRARLHMARDTLFATTGLTAKEARVLSTRAKVGTLDELMTIEGAGSDDGPRLILLGWTMGVVAVREDAPSLTAVHAAVGRAVTSVRTAVERASSAIRGHR